MNHQNSQQSTIQQAISRAKKATKKGKIADAVELYTAVLQQQPNHPIAKKRLRQLQTELPRNKPSEEEASNPPQYEITALINLYHSGQMIKAEQACRELLQSYSQSANIINILGATLQGQGKLQEAVASFDRAIQLKPDYIEVHNNLGNTLKELGRLDEAEASYTQAITLKPGYAEAHNNLSGMLLDLGRLEEAEASCRKAIALKPDFVDAHTNLAITLHKLGRLDEAEASYTQALALRPDYATVHSNLGGMLRDLGRLEEAEASCRKAIALEPGYATAHNNLGNTLKELGRLDEAEASYTQALALKPNYATPHNNLGGMLQDLGRLEEAEANCRKAIALKPNYAAAHNNLASTLHKLGRLDDALVQYKKSFKLVRGKNPVDPQHKSFRLISKAKMEHDIEQFEYLATSGYESEKFQALVDVYKAVSSEINWPKNDAEIIPLTKKYQKLFMDSYNRAIHMVEAPELPGPTLNNTLDIEKITENYFNHDFNITYFDNFLTPAALDSIRRFLLGSTVWFDFFHKGGYVGAYLRDGLACPLFLQIAEEMRTTFPKIFKNHPLKQLWAYKYDSRAYKNDGPLTGIGAHADAAAVNVNFWVTPKVANLNSSSGGLVVYHTEAPLEWNFKKFNNVPGEILEHLENDNEEKSVIPYNENRIVLFNSNLIHQTDKFEFKDGYENRRINVTMLFGERGA